MSGKGSSPRPLSVSNEEYANRWDSIFAKKEDPLQKLYDVEVELGIHWTQLELPLEDSVSANSECKHPVWGYEYTEQMYFCMSCGFKAKHPANR